MILSLLSKPYPLSDSPSGKIRAALFTGFFVFVFLFAFRPFQLHRFDNIVALKLTLGYGAVTLIMVLINTFWVTTLLPKFFNESKWTIGREISFLLWIIFTIGLGNALYSMVIFNDFFNLRYLLYFRLYTLMVAVLPVIINVMIMQLVLTRRNLKEAENISDHLNFKKRLDSDPGAVITLRSDNQKEELKIPARDLLFITSADNYIEVHYLQNGSEQKKLLRGTLRNTKNDLRTYTAFYRCHRAWIVNLDRVVSVTGNSQGYRLVLNGTDTIVPVSRNLNEEISTRLSM
ncbi:MAG: LytTR family transcriptional regulator [Bacteroidetes bacterium]|nr:LytTR family transcriptional regulator [Bacteroidota bacterium]